MSDAQAKQLQDLERYVEVLYDENRQAKLKLSAAQEQVKHLDVYIDKHRESIRKIEEQHYAELSALRRLYQTLCKEVA